MEWIGGTWEPTETSTDHPLVQTLRRSVREATGQPPRVQGMTYASDLRLFSNNFGIPGVLFGPGDIRVAHFSDEYVALSELAHATLALALTIVEFCGMA